MTAPAAGSGRSAVAAARVEVCRLHAELVRAGLVAWTSGNVSARVTGDGVAGDGTGGRT